MSGAAEVIVASADDAFSSALGRELEAQAFSVALRTSVLAALEELRSRRAAALVVDLDLAKGESRSLLRAVREAWGPGPLAVVAVFSKPFGPVDRVHALSAGAVELAPKSLEARALVRRVGTAVAAPRSRVMTLRLAGGVLRLDPARRRCTIKFGGRGRGAPREARLSPLEMRLLVCLLARRGALVTREEAVASLWPRDPGRHHLLTLAQLLARLRRKLGASGVRITTVRGLGFRIESEYPSLSGPGP